MNARFTYSVTIGTLLEIHIFYWVGIEPILFRCSQAIKDVQNSNQILLHGALSNASYEQTTYSLTWARVLNALLTKVGDDGLQAACRVTQDVPFKVWKSLRTWDSSVEEISLRFLWSEGKLTHELTDVDDKHALLQMMLWEIIRRRNNIHQDVQHFGVLPHTISSEQEVVASTYGSLLMRMLLLFKSELIAGEYDDIPKNQKEHICDLLTDVEKAFRERLLSANPEVTTPDSSGESNKSEQ